MIFLRMRNLKNYYANDKIFMIRMVWIMKI